MLSTTGQKSPNQAKDSGEVAVTLANPPLIWRVSVDHAIIQWPV